MDSIFWSTWGWWNLGAIFYRTSKISGQERRHLHSSNWNLLEHLSRSLDDSLNIFLNRCVELNISAISTVRRLLEELHSIQEHIFHIIINEHDFGLNSKHPCFYLNQHTQDLGGHDLEFQRLKLIDSLMHIDSMMYIIWEVQ